MYIEILGILEKEKGVIMLSINSLLQLQRCREIAYVGVNLHQFP